MNIVLCVVQKDLAVYPFHIFNISFWMLVNNYKTQHLPLKDCFLRKTLRKTTNKAPSFSIIFTLISTCTKLRQTEISHPTYVKESLEDQWTETHEVQKGNFEKLSFFPPDIWFLCLNSFSTLTFPNFLVLLIKTHCFHLLHLSLLWFQRR